MYKPHPNETRREILVAMIGFAHELDHALYLNEAGDEDTTRRNNRDIIRDRNAAADELLRRGEIRPARLASLTDTHEMYWT